MLMCYLTTASTDLAWIDWACRVSTTYRLIQKKFWSTGFAAADADDKSFIRSTGSFIVRAAHHQHEVLCRSCGREVKTRHPIKTTQIQSHCKLKILKRFKLNRDKWIHHICKMLPLQLNVGYIQIVVQLQSFKACGISCFTLFPKTLFVSKSERKKLFEAGGRSYFP